MKKIITFLLLAILTTSFSMATNFVTNGTFETNTDGWYQAANIGTHSFELDPTNPIMGTKSALITILTSSASTGNDLNESWFQGIYWRMSTIRDARYKVHFKARASRNLILVSQFEQKFAPFSNFARKEWNLTTTNETFEATVTNDMGVGGDWRIDFNFGHLLAGDKIWIDDVIIEEVPNELTGLCTCGDICDADFESYVANSGQNVLNGWSTVNFDPAKSTFEIDDIAPISGFYSMKVTANTMGEQFWQSQIVWNFCPVVGKNYSIEFKAKATTNVPIVVDIIDDFPVRNNSLLFQTFNITNSVDTYAADCIPSVTEYDLYTMYFHLGNLPAGNSIWLDDIKLFQKDTTTGFKTPYIDDVNTSIKTGNTSIIVSCPKVAKVNVYNIKGQLVIAQDSFAGDNTIHCENGMYIVQVIASNQIIKSGKVIIQ